MGGKRSLLAEIIKEKTGMAIGAFVKEKLKLNYASFSYRYRNGVLSLNDYHTILFYTGMTFEELFPNPLKPVAKTISLKLSSFQTIPRLEVRRTVAPNPPQVRPAEVQAEHIEHKKAPDRVDQAPAHIVDVDIDIYGDLPTD